MQTKSTEVTPTTTPAPSASGTPSDAGFRGPQVCKMIGITYRQLDYWARTHLIRPSVADAKGSGSQRLYSYTDLVELKVVKRLLDSGVSLQKSRRAIEYLREHLGGEVASAHLVLDGTTSILARSGEQIIDLLRSGQGVLNVVPLGPVVEELEAKILELAPQGDAGAPGDVAPAETTVAATGG